MTMKMRSTSGSDTAGFTLLELLLAVALLALVAVTVYGSFRATTSAIARATERGAASQAARVVLSRLSDELTSAFWDNKRPETFFVGGPALEAGQSATLLRFASRSHVWYPTQPPAVESALIDYQIQPGPHGLQLWREELANPFQLTGNPERIMMSDQLVDVQFRFYQGGSWETSWDVSMKHRLPDAVEIVLTFAEAEGAREEFRTLVSLPTKGF